MGLLMRKAEVFNTIISRNNLHYGLPRRRAPRNDGWWGSRSNDRRQGIHFIFAMILLTFLLSGCIQIDIDTGIDADFTAFLSYRVELDAGELDSQYQNLLKIALNNIGWHYQENLGFIVELNTETDACTLVMTRRVGNSSFEQAFNSLEGMLTNEDMTAFMQVDMAYQSFDRQNRFLISAMADIPQIMRLSNAEELSPPLQEKLEEAIATGKGAITLTLPASDIVNTSHHVNISNNQAVMTVPLSFTGQTGFELTGVLNLLRDGTPGGTLDEIIKEQTILRDISIVACCAVLAVLLLIMLVVVFRRRKG